MLQQFIPGEYFWQGREKEKLSRMTIDCFFSRSEFTFNAPVG